MKKEQRKGLLSVFVFMIMVLFSTPISAGEIPWQMVFSNAQGALIVGIVNEVNQEENQLTCEVLRVVDGSYDKSQVTIDESMCFDYATSQEVYFQPGDGILVSLKKKSSRLGGVAKTENGVCIVENGAYKVSIKEHRKIKFEPCTNGSYALMEWYANTGIKNTNYTYDNVSFGIGDEVLYDVETNTWHMDSMAARYIAPDTQRNKVVISIGIIIALMAIALISISCKYLKLKKSLKSE